MFGKTLALSALASLAVAAPVDVISAAVAPPSNMTVNSTVYWYYQNGRAGACGEYHEDSDKVVGLPLEYYTKFGSVSPYCGSWVEVTNPENNNTVMAKVADASTLNNTLTVSVATWNALKGDKDVYTEFALWSFANVTEASSAATSASAAATKSWSNSEEEKKASSSAAPKSEDSKYEAPASATTNWHAESSSKDESSWTPSSSSKWTPTSSEHKAAATTTSSSKAEAKTWSPSSSKEEESTWTPSSSSKAESTWTPSSSSKKEENTWTPSSSSKKTSSEWTPSTTSTKQAEQTQQSSWQSSDDSSDSSSSDSSSSSSDSWGRSGTATYFYQGGRPGNCGQYHSDSDYLVALQTSTYAGGSHCGQYITVSYGGKSIQCLVADSCPSCGSSSDIDLSVAAFQALGSLSQGVLSVNWHF